MNNKINKYDENVISLLNLRLLLTIGFIIALIISFILTYNETLSLQNKEKILSEKNSQNLSLFQSTLILIIAILFLYINYNQYLISKTQNKDSKDLLLQAQASFLALISAFICFYVIIKNYRNKNYTVAETEVF